MSASFSKNSCNLDSSDHRMWVSCLSVHLRWACALETQHFSCSEVVCLPTDVIQFYFMSLHTAVARVEWQWFFLVFQSTYGYTNQGFQSMIPLRAENYGLAFMLWDFFIFSQFFNNIIQQRCWQIKVLCYLAMWNIFSDLKLSSDWIWHKVVSNESSMPGNTKPLLNDPFIPNPDTLSCCQQTIECVVKVNFLHSLANSFREKHNSWENVTKKHNFHTKCTNSQMSRFVLYPVDFKQESELLNILQREQEITTNRFITQRHADVVIKRCNHNTAQPTDVQSTLLRQSQNLAGFQTQTGTDMRTQNTNLQK